jgi:glutathione synthase/RimK-type ligase-like ATP-grasp enzyme
MSRDGIALITAPRISDRWPDSELPVTAAAVKNLGIPTDVVAWYDNINWASYRLAVLRSPWDAYWHIDEFLTWLNDIEGKVPLLNRAATVTWNLDKRYLAILDNASVEITPTTFVEIGDPLPEFPDGEFVIKPTTSAGAIKTARYQSGQAGKAAAHIEFLHQQGLGAMLQPYMGGIDDSGERCLMFFDGVFDHAIRKQGVLKIGEHHDIVRDTEESHPNPKPHQATKEELELAHAALATTPLHDELLYARIDIVNTDSGSPAIMEVELVDPVMFFDLSDGSQDRFAHAIAQRYEAAPKV